MQRLEVSGAVRNIYGSLDVRVLKHSDTILTSEMESQPEDLGEKCALYKSKRNGSQLN